MHHWRRLTIRAAPHSNALRLIWAFVVLGLYCAYLHYILSRPHVRQRPGEGGFGKAKTAGLAAAMRWAYNGTLVVIPLNRAWLPFGLNLWCSLRKVMPPPLTGVAFFALEPEVFGELQRRQLPVFTDPAVEAVSAKRASWKLKQNSSFVRLVCSKISGVRHLLQRGVNVLLVDADVTFLDNPLSHLPPYDLTFSWGGHRNPTQIAETSIDRPKCDENDASGERCYSNTGYYFARSEPSVIRFLGEVENRCFAPTNAKDDQTILNEILKESLPALDFRIGCFNPCRFANGRTYFDHEVPQNLGIKPVAVHANFLHGANSKRKHLQKAGLWDLTCVDSDEYA
eukprot:TRINITY_DN66970_c0_g1_i1.p1 TRINITY_DN66970_c0_g1~~TRINITY_DN66970_c0_g1_i1.p1  ORF type:complete len:340 (-),score=38.99 TRINITY_DN66970_c0_g1_i1:34-1053(-)